MRRLRSVVSLCALVSAVSTLVIPAAAAEFVAYQPGVIQNAQAEGRPVVVHVTATWCSTCAAQMPIVIGLLKEPKYKNVVLVNVDFDKQKAVLRKLHVQAQSTFVVYRGKHEVGRSTGDTNKASIEKLFDKTS
jgi:Thiol-disulfide isomerase and thioredoxins